jgi:hypothetical protein
MTHTRERKSHMEFSQGVISKLVSCQGGDLLVSGLFLPQYLKDLLVAVSSIRLLLADDVMLNIMEKISTMRMWFETGVQ